MGSGSGEVEKWLEAEAMGNAPSLGTERLGWETAIRMAVIKKLEMATGSGLMADSVLRRSLQKT